MRTQWPIMLAAALLSACGQGGGGEGAGTPSPTENAAVPTSPPAPPAFAVCGSCHTVEPGRNGAGPSLAGVWGRKAGTLPGFPYSPALASSGIVWNAQTLDTWLQGPMRMVPGTRMVVGVPDAQARKAVIAYLETLK